MSIPGPASIDLFDITRAAEVRPGRDCLGVRSEELVAPETDVLRRDRPGQTLIGRDADRLAHAVRIALVEPLPYRRPGNPVQRLADTLHARIAHGLECAGTARVDLPELDGKLLRQVGPAKEAARS